MRKENKEKRFKVYKIFLWIALLSFLIYLYIELKNYTSFLNFLPKLLGLFVILLFILCFIISSIKNEGKNKFFIILGCIFLTFYSVFNSLLTLNIISLPTDEYIPNFYNLSINKVNEWKKEHSNINIIEVYEFRDDIKKYYVAGQDITPPTLAKDVKDLTLTISNGPDYNKEIVIPSFIGLKYNEVIKYIEENFLNNVTFKYTQTEDNIDTIIDQEGSGTQRRSDPIILTVATKEKAEISIPDFKNKSLLYAKSWLEKSGFKVETTYEFNDTIDKDFIINQNYKNEIKNPDEDIIILTVSKGKVTVVPDIANMKVDDINNWVIENGLKISYDEVYNDDIKMGDVVSSNLKKGDKVSSGDKIEITISKGNLKMIELSDINDFINWAKNNNIEYDIKYEYSDTVKKDNIISCSHKTGSTIKVDDTIIITVSKGKSVKVPNFINKSKNDIQNTCKTLNIDCSFKYGGTTEKTAKDIAINQSKKASTIISEGTNVLITLSSGIIEKINVPDFTGKSKNEITNTCKKIGVNCNFKYANGYSNTEKDIAVSQNTKGNVNKGSTITISLSNGPAKTYTIIIDANQLSSGNANATKNTLEAKLKNACPGVTFKFTYQKANSGIGYLAPNSEVKVGSNKLVQGKTYNVIINSN